MKDTVAAPGRECQRSLDAGPAVCVHQLDEEEKAVAEARRALAVDPEVGDSRWLNENCYWPEQADKMAAQLGAAARSK